MCIICCITFWVLHIFISSSSVIISSAVFTFFMNSLRVFHMVFLFVFFLWVLFICKNFICSCLLFTFFTETFNILNIVILKVIILIVLAFCISLGLRWLYFLSWIWFLPSCFFYKSWNFYLNFKHCAKEKTNKQTKTKDLGVLYFCLEMVISYLLSDC